MESLSSRHRSALRAGRYKDAAAVAAANLEIDQLLVEIQRQHAEAESITMRYATPPEPRIGDPVVYIDAPGRTCAATIIDVIDEAAEIVTLRVLSRDGADYIRARVQRGHDVGNWTWRDD